jgi:purine-binding chemotaxis protein CheW
MAIEQEMLLEEQEDTQHGRFLTFALDEELYGIGIRYITEIIGMQPITKLPEVADYIKGIINLRGKIIPVIDMRLKFKKNEIEYSDRTCIIVIDTADIHVGLIVDNVADVLSLNDDMIVPPPNERSGIQNKYIDGIGKTEDRVILLLNCEKLFLESEIEEISNIK